ncbi:hypothetical protein [Kistimonas asteriae]|uniref:hypothetical protein n=1 Tax=Kistimonas asteriae TaxID=517724 RepID=UPI001BAAF0E5|nr:hypothetical protein [Kistimonas asteriae]
MKALFIGLFLLLSGFSSLVSAEAMFHIQVETEGDLVKGDKGLLKLAITNRSVEAADIVLRITQTDGQVLLDKQSCPLVRPKETCRATIAVTPAKAGDQRFIVETLGFDTKYLCGKTVQLFTVYETERYKSVYLSDQKSEFAHAWALVHGLGSTEDAALYINRHDGDPLIEDRGGRTLMWSKALADADDLSQQVNVILARELEGFSGKIHLYVQSSMIADTRQVAIDSALASRLASVTVFPVDASMLYYDAARLQKLAAFASDLYGKGVETVKILLWDTIDQSALTSGSLSELGRLRDHGVVFDTFSFLNKGHNIAALGVKDLLLTGGLYAQLIPESSVINDAFVPVANYGADKTNLLFLGYHGYSDPYSEAWHELLPKKQIDILQALNNNYDESQYNSIYQSAPDDLDIKAWLSANGAVSYFKPSFPLVLWIALNEGAVTYQHNHQQQTAYFPALPVRVLSADNDLLYSLDIDRIDAILGYSPVGSQDYEQDFQAYTAFLQMVGRTRDQIPFVEYSQWISGMTDESVGSLEELTTESVSINTEQDAFEAEVADSQEGVITVGTEIPSGEGAQDMPVGAEQDQEPLSDQALVSSEEEKAGEGVVVIDDPSATGQLKPGDDESADSEQTQTLSDQPETADEGTVTNEEISAADHAATHAPEPDSSLEHLPIDNSDVVSADESASKTDKPLHYMENLVAGFSQEALAAVQASGGQVTLCVKEQPECIDGMVQGCQLILLFACCDGVCLCPEAAKDNVQQPCLWSMPLVLQATKQ